MNPEENASRSKTARNARLYTVKRTLLILLMGAKCHYCPERRPWMLEFHHTSRPDWRPAKTSRHRRIMLYGRDYFNGICVLACGRCNKKHGTPAAEGEIEEGIPD